MKTPSWSIRSKIFALVAVPIAGLLALWIFATTLAVGPATRLLNARILLDELARPGQDLVAELQRERQLSVVFLAGSQRVAAITEQRARTDQAVAEFRRRASGQEVRDAGEDLLDERLDELLTNLDTLPAGRSYIDRRQIDRSGAFGLFTGMISTAFETFAAMATLPDDTLNRQALAITMLSQGRESLSQVDALLAGVFAAGRFNEGEPNRLAQIIGTQRFLYSYAVADLPDTDHAIFQRLSERPEFLRLATMEETLVARGRAGSASPVGAEEWWASYDAVQRQLRDYETRATMALAGRTGPVTVDILVQLALAGLFGLTAVAGSLMIALRVGRSLVSRLTGLRATALDLAHERLPDVVRRLRTGAEVDVDRETPPLDYGEDEIGQVAQAFSAVQHTAVHSAVDEAILRRGLSQVFLNIARRSQTLLHRQLALLDKMERRTTDPDELADLFRADHMATRMRRHAEDLVILAGAAPGRGWRNPVPVLDVIRGAISEVEEYARVDVGTLEPAAVVGRVVGDLIHLLAELIENGASFSPPHTRVRVVAQPVANGYAIEVEDRGLGMPPEAIEEANRRLADPPTFDPANSARLGLFVVALLAARHGIRVRLRASSYGGVTAVVLVPAALITEAEPAGRAPGRDVAEETRTTAAPVRAPAGPAATGASVDVSAGPSPDGLPVRWRHTMPAAPPSAPPTPAELTAAPGPDGLPRRVRRAAPATRSGAGPRAAGTPAAVPAQDGATGPEPPGRSPEQIRSAMSSLQAGALRGRRDSAGSPASGPAGSPATYGLTGPPTARGPVGPPAVREGGAQPADGRSSVAPENRDDGRDA